MSDFKPGDDVYYISDDVRRDGKVRTFAEVCKITTGKDYSGRPEAGELYVVWSGTVCWISLKLCLQGYDLKKHVQPCHRCGLPVDSELRLVDGRHVCDLGDIADQCEKYYNMLSRICLDVQEPHNTYQSDIAAGDEVISHDLINEAREAIGWRKL
jgi:hypothetical protein